MDEGDQLSLSCTSSSLALTVYILGSSLGSGTIGTIVHHYVIPSEISDT